MCSLTVRHWQWTNGPCRELHSAPWNEDWMVLTGKNYTRPQLCNLHVAQHGRATKTISLENNITRISRGQMFTQKTCFGFLCFYTFSPVCGLLEHPSVGIHEFLSSTTKHKHVFFCLLHKKIFFFISKTRVGFYLAVCRFRPMTVRMDRFQLTLAILSRGSR